MPIPVSPEPSALLGPDRVAGAAAFGVYLFAFAAPFSVSLAELGQALFVLAFLAQGPRLRPLLREPVVRAGLVFAAFVGLHSLAWYLQAPTAAYAQGVVRTGADWIKLLLFIPLAWWLAMRPRRIGWVLLLAALGLALGFLRKLDWLALDAGFFTQQFVNYLQPLALGLFSGVGVIGLLVCRAELLAVVRPGPWRWLAVAGYVLLVALLLELLVLSFSRTAWLGFAACLVLWGALTAVRSLRRGKPMAWRRGLWGGAAALSLLGLVVTLNLDTLSSRLGTEQQTLAQVASGGLEETNRSSLALRLHVWRFGLGIWLERPWFGWGAGSSSGWIRESGLPQLWADDRWLAHLHNTYLELLFQFGLIGALLFLALPALLVRTTARTCQGQSPGSWPGGPRCLCDLLLMAAVFVALWVLMDHRATNHDWRSFWMLLAGSAYALHLARGLPAHRTSGRDCGPGSPALAPDGETDART
jgi:O-antigen ligase